MKKTKSLAIFLLLMLVIGCVTNEEDDKFGYNYGVDDNKNKPTASNDDENKPPSTYVRVQNFRSGDTFIMVSGKILKLAGIKSPKIGEPFYKKAKDAIAFSHH